MQTNANIPKESELYIKGAALINAANEYWKEYQKNFTAGAVVWLEADNGHFILFTRSEYKRGIVEVIDSIGGAPLNHPFET